MLYTLFHEEEMECRKLLIIKKLWPFCHSSVAVLVLAWDYMMYAHNVLLRYFIGIVASNVISENKSKTIPGWYYSGIGILACFSFLFFPIFGLLADVWIGRYKAIHIGAALCFFSWLIGGVVLTLEYFHEKFIWINIFLVYAIQLAGYVSFKSNIMQYNIDQLIGSSAEELSTVIYWHSAAVPIVCTVTQLLRCFLNSMPEYFGLYSYMASGVCVSLVLVTHSLFRHKLENVSLVKNPIKLIVRVLCYARKHKYPENRSALTYWEEEAPSRLDLGKRKYGGPFTEEEVEDVKTFFRMLPLFIALIGFALSDDVYNCIYIKSPDNDLISCFIMTDFVYFSCSCVILLAYLLLFRILLYKCIPSMLTRIGIGLVFSLFVLISRTIVFKLYFNKDMTAKPPHYNSSLFIPQVLVGIAFTLVIPSSLEFTIAQTPVHMRGVMVGLWLASLGIGYLVDIGINIPFGCHSDHICTNSNAYLVASGVVLFTLIVFAILAKRYRYRVRENEVNIVQIVDEVYQRYIEQDSTSTNGLTSSTTLQINQ